MSGSTSQPMSANVHDLQGVGAVLGDAGEEAPTYGLGCITLAHSNGTGREASGAGMRRRQQMLDEAVFTASDLMTRDVAVVHPETSLLDAVKLMAERRISGVPVLDDDGRIVGMLSEGDLVRWHEGYTERQARWLDMLGDGFLLAPAILERI